MSNSGVPIPDRDVFVESLGRLIPFVLRQRTALLVSVALSIGAALFAVAQLSLVYPAMKLLLEGKTYDQHIRAEYELAETAVKKEAKRLAELELQLQDPEWLAKAPESEKRLVRRDFQKTQADTPLGPIRFSGVCARDAAGADAVKRNVCLFPGNACRQCRAACDAIPAAAVVSSYTEARSTDTCPGNHTKIDVAFHLRLDAGGSRHGASRWKNRRRTDQGGALHRIRLRGELAIDTIGIHLCSLIGHAVWGSGKEAEKSGAATNGKHVADLSGP